MFLSTWNAYKHQDDDYAQYQPHQLPPIQQDGYVVAYGDSPVDHEETGENIYLNLINQAQKEIRPNLIGIRSYVYIFVGNPPTITYNLSLFQ